MAAVVRNSVLNPLATCFVPSNLRAFCGDNTTVALKTVSNEVNAEKKSNDTKTTNRLNHPLTKTDLACLKNKYPADKKCREELKDKKSKRNIKDSTAVLFRIPSFVPKSLPTVIQSKPKFLLREMLGISNLILLAVAKLIYNEIYHVNNYVEISEVEETEGSETGEECLCPPMFGWVIPPTFFGNPLNLRYDCNKNYVHSPKYLGELNLTRIRKDESLRNCERENSTVHVSEEKETLEQYSLEFQMIIRDVCNSVREEDPSELGVKGNSDYLELSDTPENGESELGKTVWNDTLGKDSSDEQIIDDGSHPLLQSLPSNISNEDEEVRESIEVVENILEKCLLPGKEFQLLDVERQTESSCIPPCSYWCNDLPPAARETFKRFRVSQRHRGSRMSAALNPVGRRPLYKRSFSADDTPMNATPGPDVTIFASEEESKERLLRLRKDTVAYFKNNELSDTRPHRHSLSKVSNCLFRYTCLSTESNQTTWGPFDGADSLWKPLPDCTPSNDCNQKSSHKKAREVRRMKSMN